MNIEQLANDFAKQSKISKAKTMAFAQAILEQAKQEMPKAGRKTSEESIRIRNAIKDSIDSLRGVVFTSKDLAEKFNADQAYIVNNLKYLAEHDGIVKAVGKKEKEPGQAGRKEILWSVA
tara:strand:- start:16159 stop:16518 length:360 start_codon:yes stop_codon:yes gene_type:complete